MKYVHVHMGLVYSFNCQNEGMESISDDVRYCKHGKCATQESDSRQIKPLDPSHTIVNFIANSRG